MNQLHVCDEAARLGLHGLNRQLLDYWLTLAGDGWVPSHLAFGANLVGEDWPGRTLIAHRRQRLISFRALAQGALRVARRTIPGRDQARPQIIEELLLPFVPTDGVPPVLVHSSWRPQAEEGLGVDGAAGFTLACEFHLNDFVVPCSRV